MVGKSILAAWRNAVIILILIWEPTLGWRWITQDAVVQNVWPVRRLQDAVKFKRASSANAGPIPQKQGFTKPHVSETPEDDFLVFDGHYFKPEEVPPPPDWMVVNSNWRAKSPNKNLSPPAPPPPPILQEQQRPSSYISATIGRLPVAPAAPQKFTEENAVKSSNISEQIDTDSTSSSNTRNIFLSSSIPLEDMQHHEEELVAFEEEYKDAPKCFTPTDVPGRCISFRNCFPVVYNTIDGDLRNPGLAKLLYQASGPCNASLELDFAMEKLNDHKKFLNVKFYNQTICCPGFKHPPTLLKAWTKDGRTARLITESPVEIPFGEKEYASVPLPSPETNEPTSTAQAQSSAGEDKFIPSQLDSFARNETIIDVTSPPLKANESSVEDLEGVISHDEEEMRAVINLEEDFEGIDLDENDDFAEREQLRLADTEIVKESPKVAYRNYSGVESADNARRGDRDKMVDVGYSNPQKPYDTYLAVDPPGVSPINCRHQLHGMPRGHWPWMVALVVSSRHICSGALIDAKHVLTAAHCVYLLNQKEIRKLRVIIGDRVMYSSVDGPHFWRKVNKITTHVNYDQQTFASDIAILRLNSAVPFSRNIQPISLPDGSSLDSTNFRNAIVAGWSGADIGQPAFEPRTEVETVVDIMDKSECRNLYRGFALSGIATNTFCTKPANNTCVADSGAPLIVRVQNCWRLMGIMSWGIGCSHFPEVYTDVSRYLDWLEKHIEE